MGQQYPVGTLARGGAVISGTCGHIHKAEIRMLHEVLYCKDGDWVESLTALVEDHAGNLRIIEWKEIRVIEAVPVLEEALS